MTNWILLISLLVVPFTGVTSRPRCGGTYTATRGVLQTPNFPSKFSVPIHCEWVIEAQHASSNSSIVVYLTQLFVFEGLTFQEYQIYDKTYQLNGKEIHTVTENNISRVSYVQTYQDYLVISLKLDSIESTHLRVLDHLLDVYGFNITYEITGTRPRDDRCTMAMCGFTGHCYDYYTKFKCSCFPGYTGRTCSSGKNSLCTVRNAPACKHGGICTHVGDSAIRCNCTDGFAGEACTDRVEQTPTKNDCEDCLQTCQVDESKLHLPCKCSGKNKLNNELIAYFISMQVIRPINMRDDQLKKYAENQLTKALRENVTPLQDAKIIHYESAPSGVDLTFRFYSNRKEERTIRATIVKWKESGHSGNMNLTHKDTLSFTSDPLVSLQGVNINQAGPIREGGDFILSCVARGSPNVSFRWFKDNVFVNVSSSTSYKWTRLIEDPNIKDQYTALLGIDRASVFDKGLFTCQIIDYGIQQCLSRRVEVRSPPKVWIEPMSLTVRKGENFTIKCFSASNSKVKIKYTYSWTKNHLLLPIKTDTEHYEILYPMGSILQVSSINKSTSFSCLVQDELVSAEMSISVTVVYGGNSVLSCPGEGHLNVLWPETAPGTESLQECPREYSGVARRFCGIHDTGLPTWQMPDYSGCTPTALLELDTQFQKLKYGYSTTSPLEILTNYLKYLEGLSYILPGEGARVLNLVDDVIRFIATGAIASGDGTKQARIKDISTIVLRIADRILQYKHSLMNESQTVLVQQVIRRQAQLIKPGQLFHRTFTTLDVTLAPPDKTTPPTLRIPTPENSSYPRWFSYKLHLSLGENYSATANNKSTTETLAVVVYRNLSAFLPTRSVIRLKDGIEMEYELLSNIASVWALTNKAGAENIDQTLTMEFGHTVVKNSTDDVWNINCAVADFASYGYSWDLQYCRTRILDSSATRCTCTRSGTFAVLMTKKPTTGSTSEDTTHTHIIVLVGCCTCLFLSSFSGLILLTYWLMRRSCLEFIKVQCCASIIGAMVVFIYAIWTELSEESSFLYVMSFLESFLLTAMSSQLSKLLVVYTEIVQLQRMGSIKQTVMLIITGAPLIAVFGNHLAHRSMSTRVNSWWLIIGTLSFNVFITCFVILIGLFCLVYNVTVKKMAAIKKKYEKQAEVLDCRIKLVHRSAYVFYSTSLMTFSSIAYINFPMMMMCHYLFASLCVLLGLVTLLCYIFYSEISLRMLILVGIRDAKDKKPSLDGGTDPLKFYTKQRPEAENDSANYPSYFVKNGKGETHFMGEMSSPTFKTYASATFPEHSDRMDYNNPQQFMPITTIQAEVKCYHSPDILGSEKFVELDLVASSMQVSQFSPPEAKAEVICIPSVSSRVPRPPIITVTDEASKADERHQPEGQEKVHKVSEVVETPVDVCDRTKFGDNLDEMMDKISHDLDYLLNDNELAVQPLPLTQSLKRVSKSQVCVFEQIAEETEEEVKVPEAITNLSRTDC